jgi:flagellar protein FliJ
VSGFRLAALLRLRTMQEDDALAGLGRAQHGLGLAAAATVASRQALQAAGPVPSGSGAVFLAGVASRAALAVAVGDSVALQETAGRDVEANRSAWQAARARSRAVSRLEDKHEEQQRTDLARREQAQADELTSARWRRTEDTDE